MNILTHKHSCPSRLHFSAGNLLVNCLYQICTPKVCTLVSYPTHYHNCFCNDHPRHILCISQPLETLTPLLINQESPERKPLAIKVLAKVLSCFTCENLTPKGWTQILCVLIENCLAWCWGLALPWGTYSNTSFVTKLHSYNPQQRTKQFRCFTQQAVNLPDFFFQLKSILMAGYFTFDHFVWSGHAGLITDTSILTRAQKTSSYCWFGGSLCTIICECHAILELCSLEKGCASDEDWVEELSRIKAEVNRRSLVLLHACFQVRLNYSM